jgi:hypothetical protein
MLEDKDTIEPFSQRDLDERDDQIVGRISMNRTKSRRFASVFPSDTHFFCT